MQSWSDGMRWNFALSRWGMGGWWIFAGAEGGRVRGLAHREALGKRKGSGGGILGFGPWSLVLLQDPAARRATLVDRLRDGRDDEQGRAFAERWGALKSWQNGTILARILGHLWIGLVYRRAFFERKFGAIFEHAKATI